MMRPRNALLVAVSLLPAALAGCSSSSDGGVLNQPRTLTVGASADADYESIQQAVDAAPAGSTIRVEPGLYVERIHVAKRLTIGGTGPGVVVEYPAGGPQDSAVIEIRDAGGVRIEALSVRASPLAVDGIRVRNANGVVLQSVEASNNSEDGVDIRDSRGVDVITGSFESNGGDGVQVDEGSGNVKILSCRAASNGSDGIKIRDSTEVLVEDSKSTLNLDDGILVRAATEVRLVGNSVTGNNGWGISVNDSPDTVLDDNTMDNNGVGDLKCEPTPCSSSP
jgi:parallel beta-helix repeat protein